MPKQTEKTPPWGTSLLAPRKSIVGLARKKSSDQHSHSAAPPAPTQSTTQPDADEPTINGNTEEKNIQDTQIENIIHKEKLKQQLETRDTMEDEEVSYGESEAEEEEGDSISDAEPSKEPPIIYPNGVDDVSNGTKNDSDLKSNYRHETKVSMQRNPPRNDHSRPHSHEGDDSPRQSSYKRKVTDSSKPYESRTDTYIPSKDRSRDDLYKKRKSEDNIRKDNNWPATVNRGVPAAVIAIQTYLDTGTNPQDYPKLLTDLIDSRIRIRAELVERIVTHSLEQKDTMEHTARLLQYLVQTKQSSTLSIEIWIRGLIQKDIKLFERTAHQLFGMGESSFPSGMIMMLIHDLPYLTDLSIQAADASIPILKTLAGLNNLNLAGYVKAALIEGLIDLQYEPEAWTVFTGCAEKGIILSLRCCGFLIKHYSLAQDYEKARLVFSYMYDSKFTVNPESIADFINRAHKHISIDTICELLDKTKTYSQVLNKDKTLGERMLKHYIAQGNTETSLKLFETMLENRMVLLAVSITQLINLCANPDTLWSAFKSKVTKALVTMESSTRNQFAAQLVEALCASIKHSTLNDLLENLPKQNIQMSLETLQRSMVALESRANALKEAVILLEFGRRSGIIQQFSDLPDVSLIDVSKAKSLLEAQTMITMHLAHLRCLMYTSIRAGGTGTIGGLEFVIRCDRLINVRKMADFLAELTPVQFQVSDDRIFIPGDDLREYLYDNPIAVATVIPQMRLIPDKLQRPRMAANTLPMPSEREYKNQLPAPAADYTVSPEKGWRNNSDLPMREPPPAQFDNRYPPSADRSRSPIDRYDRNPPSRRGNHMDNRPPPPRRDDDYSHNRMITPPNRGNRGHYGRENSYDGRGNHGPMRPRPFN